MKLETINLHLCFQSRDYYCPQIQAMVSASQCLAPMSGPLLLNPFSVNVSLAQASLWLYSCVCTGSLHLWHLLELLIPVPASLVWPPLPVQVQFPMTPGNHHQGISVTVQVKISEKEPSAFFQNQHLQSCLSCFSKLSWLKSWSTHCFRMSRPVSIHLLASEVLYILNPLYFFNLFPHECWCEPAPWLSSPHTTVIPDPFTSNDNSYPNFRHQGLPQIQLNNTLLTLYVQPEFPLWLPLIINLILNPQAFLFALLLKINLQVKYYSN